MMLWSRGWVTGQSLGRALRGPASPARARQSRGMWFAKQSTASSNQSSTKQPPSFQPTAEFEGISFDSSIPDTTRSTKMDNILDRSLDEILAERKQVRCRRNYGLRFDGLTALAAERQRLSRKPRWQPRSAPRATGLSPRWRQKGTSDMADSRTRADSRPPRRLNHLLFPPRHASSWSPQEIDAATPATCARCLGSRPRKKISLKSG